MSSLFINGIQYGDSIKWSDILSKPTINTNIVEQTNTSSSLEIFKYITKEDFDLLHHPNPYCIYAVRQDEIERIYFSNGNRLYVYNDYTVVTELIEDPTMLQYLPEDTELHPRGLWGYLEVSKTPSVFEFVRILNNFDNKSIDASGDIYAQKDGYISGTSVEIVELLNLAIPKSLIASADYNTLIFDPMPYNYMPNSKYELTINYIGSHRTLIYEPNEYYGNDVLDFSKELKIKLDVQDYPSTIATDYTVSLTWYKPTELSYINPLYINISDDFKIVEGLLTATTLANEFSSISKTTNYLYTVHYDYMDYLYAAENLQEQAPPLGSCSSFKSNKLYGRNYDGIYGEYAEFVVVTDKTTTRNGVIGTAYSNAKPAQIEAGVFPPATYRALPFNLLDGINSAGVAISIHSLPGVTSTIPTIPAISTLKTSNAFILLRELLENYSSAASAATYVRDYVSVTIPETYTSADNSVQIFITDSVKSYVLEFIDGENILIDVSSKPFATNFSMKEVVYNTDGSLNRVGVGLSPSTTNKIPLKSRGITRYNIMNSKFQSGVLPETIGEMYTLMESVLFENRYSPVIPDDFTGIETLTVDSSMIEFITSQKIRELCIEWTTTKSRDHNKSLCTLHSCIYDLANLTMHIKVEDDNTHIYTYSLPYEEEKKVWEFNRFSTTGIDASQNTKLQEYIDTVVSSLAVTTVNYDKCELLFTDKTIDKDNTGSYFSLASVLDEEARYVQVRVYLDPTTYEVIGAREYDIKLVTYGTEPAPTTLLYNTIFATPIAP